MLRTFGRSAATMLVVALGAACSDGGPFDTTQPHVVEAVVDGGQFRSTERQTIGERLVTGRELIIRGRQTSADGVVRDIEMLIRDYAGPGTYTLSNPDTRTWGFYKVTHPGVVDPPLVYLSSDSSPGTITVTEESPSRAGDSMLRDVRGTFEFRGVSNRGSHSTIQAGRFSGSVNLSP